jgi:hypothetical protein
MPCLFRILSGPYRGKVFPVEATRPLLIGRALEADFTIPDGTIEAFHCRVEFESGANGRMAKVVCLDPRPEKQLEVDGCPFDSALLKSGDRVKIGDTALEFLEGGKPQDPVAGRAAEIGRPCVSCRQPVHAIGGGRVLLGGTYCARCVDLRLTVKRELGRYRVMRKIGRDAAEIVYLAEDLRSEPPERVALHVLKSERQHDPRVLRRFLTKAAFGQTLDHPLFSITRDLVRKPEVTSFTEEFCDWPSLSERLETSRLLLPHVAAKVARQVAEGLARARKSGIIVGKIRAQKLLIADNGSVRLREYWLTPEVEERMAKQVGAPAALPLPEAAGPADVDLTVAQAGEKGNEAALSADLRRYLVPEARDIAHWKDESLDARQAGGLFLQLVLGNISGEMLLSDVVERMKRAHVAGRRPKASPEPPPLLTRVVTRILDKSPSVRYPNILEMAADLKALIPLL